MRTRAISALFLVPPVLLALAAGPGGVAVLLVILAVIGIGIVIDWLHLPVWLIAIPGIAGAVLVWLKLCQED